MDHCLWHTSCLWKHCKRCNDKKHRQTSKTV